MDLIAGLPHQTRESWNSSLAEAMATGVPHLSVYMLDVDEDSRLGREIIAGGTRYGVGMVPNEQTIADLYTEACEQFAAAGIAQYEISNFARAGHRSRHNLKYWTRQPYLGFGLDAHSFLPTTDGDAIRVGTTDDLRGLFGSERDARRTGDHHACLGRAGVGRSVVPGSAIDRGCVAGGRSSANLAKQPIRTFQPILVECAAAGADRIR